jgi:3-deoxy-manno-octulosonate cytidylyltransferase (CMP-KDO synthetase)
MRRGAAQELPRRLGLCGGIHWWRSLAPVRSRLTPASARAYVEGRGNTLCATRLRAPQGSMRTGVLGIVPARLASTRLPNKPLYPILGRPLIEWVWRRVEQLPILDHAVVATDSEEVAEVCRSFGAPVEMTSLKHPSGTDRVAEVAARGEYRDFPIIANIQGDEPLLEEGQLSAAVRLVRDEGWEVGTCATHVLDEDARKDPSVVKVVRATSGQALYFSRAQIPYRQEGKPTREELEREPFLRHIGIYVFTRDALAEWVALAPSPLEGLEGLEQLRPLEAGLRIGVAVVGAAGFGVDTPSDVVRLEERLMNLGNSQPFDTKSK